MKYISKSEEYHTLIADNDCIINFTATWCKPCQEISGWFSSMQEKYPNINFYKVDVDENEDLVNEQEIQKMPSFQMIKKGKHVETITGCNQDKITKALDFLSHDWCEDDDF